MESGQAGPSFSRPTAAVFIFNLIGRHQSHNSCS